MYESYWHLTRRPFDGELDAGLYVPAAAADAALLKLEYAVDSGKGVAVLAGPAGVGKTFLTHVLESRLRGRAGDFARVLYPRLDPAGLVQQFCARLGMSFDEIDGRSLAASLELFRWRVRELGQETGPPVLVVDDAHLIECPELWHCLRMLLNVRDEPGCDFTLLLVGQPALLGRLQSYPDLADRAGVRVAMPPLDAAGVEDYLRGRLAAAGVADGVFDVDGVEAVSDLSEGLPRRINQIADLALLVGYADRLPLIGREQAEDAAGELRGVSVG